MGERGRFPWEAHRNRARRRPRLRRPSHAEHAAGRQERLEKLEEYAKAKDTDPLIWQMFGYELGLDARQHDRAIRWLFRSMRAAPGTALTYRLLADILWSKRTFDKAAELYRFAATLDDKNEDFAYAFFQAMRHLKREEEALGMLSDRARRFVKQSGMPSRSLFNAQREMGLVGEAFATLPPNTGGGALV